MNKALHREAEQALEPRVAKIIAKFDCYDVEKQKEKQLGQAKLKGSFEQRQAQAITHARAQFPTSVKCNNCGNDLTEIQPMDVRGMPGMRLAGGAVCVNCSQTTWVIDGTLEAIAQLQEHMAKEHGEEAKIGFAKKPSL